MRPNGEEIQFEIDPFRKHLLLNGLDDIGQTLQHAATIDGYEAQCSGSWMRDQPDPGSPIAESAGLIRKGVPTACPPTRNC